jgi:DNA-binding HxlR family transcriptional regulator
VTNPKASRFANRECSMVRAMAEIGDRWSILIMREAFYGVKRFDEFEYYIGVAPNVLSSRLKRLVKTGILRRTALREHAGRFEYALTEKGCAFLPAYLAIKRWGDDWLSEPKGPQVLFVEALSGLEVAYPALSTKDGRKLLVSDLRVVAGSGAVAFNRKRFGSKAKGKKIAKFRAKATKGGVPKARSDVLR